MSRESDDSDGQESFEFCWSLRYEHATEDIGWRKNQVRKRKVITEEYASLVDVEAKVVEVLHVLERF